MWKSQVVGKTTIILEISKEFSLHSITIYDSTKWKH